MTRAVAILCLALALTGCRWGVRDCPSIPVEIEVPVPVREPIPEELTLSIDSGMCFNADGSERPDGPTVGDVREQRRAACAEIEKGNARFQQLRALRPEDAP